MVAQSDLSLDPRRAELVDEVKLDLFAVLGDAGHDAKRKEIARSFISDTITVPSQAMLDYAAKAATLGDDVYGDPTTSALEAHLAKITGKEAGIFMASGTMSNQIALRCHLVQPPYTVLCDHRAHIHCYEVGGTAFHSGAGDIPVIPANGRYLTLKDVEAQMVYGPDVHFAPTEVIALENTLGGCIIPQDEVIAISNFAHSKGIKMHLDGARIWHVSIETGKSLKELCDPFDTVSLCLSKGLGAPVGSCLVGPRDLITKARRFRKLFGGGMRQTGFIAACAAYALSNNFAELHKTHALAKKLQAGLEDIGARILGPAETCMVMYDPSPLGLTYHEIGERASKLPEPLHVRGAARLVLHIQTSEEAVDDLLALIRTMADEKAKAGFNPTNGVKANGGNIYG